MTTPTLLVATWNDGLFALTGPDRRQTWPGSSVRGLSRDRRGNVLAIIDGRSLCRLNASGVWETIAEGESELSCCVAVEDKIYVGTDDARLLITTIEGGFQALEGFQAVPGRDSWFAGSAVINGQVVGPPLGVRSIAATADGQVLLANVHVGGIPRSTDGGATWHPTIDVNCDVHEVCAHPEDPQLVVAAAAVGFCISRDAGATWAIERDGLHAEYCSAVAFSGEDVLISASADHFAPEGAVYARAIDGSSPIRPLRRGLPDRIEGIADTDCLAVRGPILAVADKGGNLYVSTNAGDSWSRHPATIPQISSIAIV